MPTHFRSVFSNGQQHAFDFSMPRLSDTVFFSYNRAAGGGSRVSCAASCACSCAASSLCKAVRRTGEESQIGDRRSHRSALQILLPVLSHFAALSLGPSRHSGQGRRNEGARRERKQKTRTSTRSMQRLHSAKERIFFLRVSS